MRPIREKRQQYGGDPRIEIQRPEPVRVRHQEPAKISGKATTLGQLVDRTIDAWVARGIIGRGRILRDTPRAESKRQRQKARRKEYLEGVMLVEIPNESTDRQRENRRKSEIAIARTLAALKHPPPEVLRANKYLSAETAESRLSKRRP